MITNDAALSAFILIAILLGMVLFAVVAQISPPPDGNWTEF